MWKKKWFRVFMIFVVFVLFLIAAYRIFLKPAEPVSPNDRASVHVMPLPASLKLTGGRLLLPATFTVARTDLKYHEQIEKMVQRFTQRLNKLVPAQGSERSDIPVRIHIDGNETDSLLSTKKEGYVLKVKSGKVVIHAGGIPGVRYAFETLLQLVSTTEQPYIPEVVIHDRPRYPWRGLMIDVCRHWIPKEVMLRSIDAMAALKLNVLHLHLTEYQAFRIESKTYPLLQEKGSGGDYFTQEEIKEIIQYAGERGIRIIPEFDLPGHCTSWFAGYPQLATVPAHYVPDTTFGVLYPLMDPTRVEVYDFLDRFFGEMATLFPDPYIHIGGDEVNAKQWDESEHVQLFMQQHQLEDAHALQAYFNKRMDRILEKHGKKMMGWDEILNPSLPEDIVVQSWRNQKSLFDAVRRGGNAILSAGYYLDHKLPAGKHYQVDPEVLPGAVDIEPDSLHWKTFDLDMEVTGQHLEGSMTLFGTSGMLRGVVTFMGSTQAFHEATMENDQLDFLLPSDYGKIKFRLQLQGDSLSGKANLSLIGIDVHGTITGSNDLPGTSPPVVERMKPLTGEEKHRILGGEACMWSELVDAETLASRIWPRTAAIAEKLWTPASLTTDTEDMYRRLEVTDSLLTKFGLQHHAHYLQQLRRLAGERNIDTLKAFVDILEEVKYYDRMGIYKLLTVHTPLNKVVDAAWPESYPARAFNRLVARVITQENNQMAKDSLSNLLIRWKSLNVELLPNAKRDEQVAEVMPLLGLLSQLSTTSLALMENSKNDQQENLLVQRLDSLVSAAEHPVEGVLLAVQPGFRQLADHYTLIKK